MKLIRYALFFLFLSVLALSAGIYAAPDLIFLSARAAGDAGAGCGGEECEAASIEPLSFSPVGVLESPAGVADPEPNVQAPLDLNTAEAQAPSQSPGALAIAPDDLRQGGAALRPEALATGGRDESSRAEADRSINEVSQLDPGLADELTTRGVDLADMLRIEADLNALVQDVGSGQAGIVRGVFVPDTLSLPVDRQPSGYPGYISGEEGVATQFGMAETYGSIGLLAHNYLAGSRFFNLDEGQEVYLVYGDREVRRFVVTEIHRYRAGQPNSPYSDFYDLDEGGAKYTAREVFHMMYNRDGDLVFQTCIAGDGISTWGRLFVIARPV